MKSMYARFVVLTAMAFGSTSPLSAQQATTSRDARTAYGSRLDQQSIPELRRSAARRLDTRVESRISNRLETRVERYSVLADPVASLRKSGDSVRQPVIVQAPLPIPD